MPSLSSRHCEERSDEAIQRAASTYSGPWRSSTRDYFAVLLRLSYLAPDITAAILDVRQPVQLNRQRLARAANLPLEWQAQREMLGFARSAALWRTCCTSHPPTPQMPTR
jgi:hypothetical protein